MKRNEIIQKLISEGFSEKTLVNFTDKQLNDLSSRMLGEQATGRGAVIMKKSSNPTDIKRVTDSGMNVELREKEEGGLNPVDTLKSDEISKIWNHIKDGDEPSRKEMKLDIFKYMKKHDCTLDSLKEKCLKESQLEVNEWVSNLAETNYHSFTSKNEIMELISMKLNESEIHEFGPNVTKGHNGIPEWFSSKSITGNNPAPVIAPPKTKPGTKPKRRIPFQPGPGPNPRPDAVMELDEFKLPQRKRDNDPIDPFTGPYKNDPMRRFNEPEEPKTNPKKKEEKKKDYPVPMEVAENKPAPVIAPPKTKPGQKPKRRIPFQPGPGPNPRPDALMDVSEQPAPAPVKAPPKVKPGQKPKRRIPFQPGPGPNPRPDALREDKLGKNKK